MAGLAYQVLVRLTGRERYRARVIMVEGAVNGALSASGMIAYVKDGNIYMCK